MELEKSEVEKKVSKLVKFIQNKNKIPKDSKRELLGIVNDLQEQCQSLCSVFDNFQQDLDLKDGGRREGKSHIASSSYDLEYYSSDEIENVVEGENENSELKRKLEALKNEAEEKERGLTLRVKELERELGDAKAECDRKRGLEEEIAMKTSESKQIGEKNKGLRSQISGLESVLKEKGDEVSTTFVNKFGNSELGLTSRIKDLNSQLRNLEQEIGFLRARNSELAGSLEVKRVEEKERVKGLTDQVNGMKQELETLRNQKDEFETNLEKKVEKVTEKKMQLKSLKEEREEERNKLNEEINHLKGENQKLQTRITELDSLHLELKTKKADEIEYESKKLDVQVSDQKKLVKEKVDMINRLSEKIKDQEKLLKEQKDTIDKFNDDLKQSKRRSFGSSRDTKLNPNALERKMEELAEDFRMKIEDHIRILYRRIHVAEQIHLESKRDYMKTLDTAQENRENKESMVLFENHMKIMKDVLEKGNSRSEMAMKKLKEAEEAMNRVAKLAKEIDSTILWVRERKSELETLTAELECKEAQETLLKEKLAKLEKKLTEEGKEKLSLTKVLSRVESKMKELEMIGKVREVELLSLGEEKREAIRQLCIVVDYLRDRYYHLKKSILNVNDLKT